MTEQQSEPTDPEIEISGRHHELLDGHRELGRLAQQLEALAVAHVGEQETLQYQHGYREGLRRAAQEATKRQIAIVDELGSA